MKHYVTLIKLQFLQAVTLSLLPQARKIALPASV